jgi:hypothetical protein
MYDTAPLELLGLAKKWRKLARLQNEVADLQARYQEAQQEAHVLAGGIQAAREQDLEAEVRATRAGKEAPTPHHEREAKAKLEGAERNRDVLERAVASATQDLAAFKAKHAAELYADIVAARQSVAARLSEPALQLLRDFDLYMELGYVEKNHAPPPPPADELAPGGNSFTVLGQLTTQRTSGPERGTVESVLRYLASLAQPGADDAA